MATYSPNVSEKSSSTMRDDEVLSLRPVLDLFFGWWREIFLLTLLAAAIGAGISLYEKSHTIPFYEATSQVALARIVSNVQIDSTIQTSMSNGDGPAESIARRASLLGLVKNGTVANQVLEELGPMLDG